MSNFIQKNSASQAEDVFMPQSVATPISSANKSRGDASDSANENFLRKRLVNFREDEFEWD